MARPFNKMFRSTAVVGSPALAAETIVASLGNIATDGPGQAVFLFGFVTFTVGTAGTAATVKIRQTGLGGTTVVTSGALTGGIAAGNVVAVPVIGADAPGDVAGFTYVLTLQVTSASAASGVGAVALVAIVADA